MASNVKILPGMNMADAALLSAGSMEDLFLLAQANGKSLTDDLEPGEILIPSGQKYRPSTPPIIADPVSKPVQSMAGQTLLDSAIQQVGGMDGLFILARLNGFSVTHDLTDGQQLEYPLTPVNRQVQTAFQNNGWKPASATTQVKAGDPPPVNQLEGVDYWGIEIDFIIS
jgi:hypothetical protein